MWSEILRRSCSISRSLSLPRSCRIKYFTEAKGAAAPHLYSFNSIFELICISDPFTLPLTLHRSPPGAPFISNLSLFDTGRLPCTITSLFHFLLLWSLFSKTLWGSFSSLCVIFDCRFSNISPRLSLSFFSLFCFKNYMRGANLKW